MSSTACRDVSTAAAITPESAAVSTFLKDEVDLRSFNLDQLLAQALATRAARLRAEGHRVCDGCAMRIHADEDAIALDGTDYHLKCFPRIAEPQRWTRCTECGQPVSSHESTLIARDARGSITLIKHASCR